ncbi:sialic acid synthase isoform X2 [Eupeodes corollae]|uniref:sialic acid synthase isoform X2 n=1 Tax=Eupeodes corollae TaxID=290404 RepID=UPI00249116FA|nr:sialic acid synthase isoform X2 [Eupeodes corollae]
MVPFKIGHFSVGSVEDPVFIIAEIGQNHQGCIETAKKLIKAAKVSLEEIVSLKLPFIKIGSGDANNFKLLEKAAQLRTPVIISTGMQTMATIKTIIQIMEKSNKTNFALMHCISSYPTKPEDCKLLTIQLLQNKFPNVLIGYSGHEVSPYISESAILLGAKIIERHLTLDKMQKGSDHSCSLTPMEFESLVKTIRSYEHAKMLQIPKSTRFIINHFNDDENVRKSLEKICGRKILNCEQACRKKLGKSLVTAKVIFKGEMLTQDKLNVKVSQPLGVVAERLWDCVGQFVNKDLSKDTPLQCNDIIGFV